MSQLILVPALAIAVALGLAVLVLAAIRVAGAIAAARLRRSHPPAGRLVPAAGTTFHVLRDGPERGPTVVLVAGVGGVAASWTGIVRALGPSVATFAYDRAGLGWSGPARGPRTAAALADELHELLEATGAAAPFVVVGHSLGGLVARQLARRHPEGIAGLVLVDSSHEEQYSRLPEVARIARRMSGMPGFVMRLMGSLAAIRAGRSPLDPRLPHDAAAAVRAGTAMNPGHLPTVMAEMRAAALGQAPIGDLGDLPLVVLRHGRYERMPMLDTSTNDRFEALFAELQAELAASSTRGRLIVADGAGHDIQLDRPDLVVEAIRSILDETEAAAAGSGMASDLSGRSTGSSRPTRISDPRMPAGEGAAPLSTRIAAALAVAARPLLVLTGVLVASGAVLAVGGFGAGWLVYLAGYASAALTLPALAVVHRDRIGRGGRLAFVIATVTVILGTPVVAMVATYVLRIDALHLALMPYAVSLPGMLGALGVNVAVALVGVIVARAGVVPARSGWLLAASVLLELPVELGILPLAAWAVAMSGVAAAMLLMARSIRIGASARSALALA